MVSIPRALAAWQDLAGNKHLAVGMQNIANTSTSVLSVITNATNQINITPTFTVDNVAPIANTTNLSSTVNITDNVTANVTSYDAVFIETHVAVDGMVLYGLYPTTQFTSTSFNITATDILGNPLPATSTAGNATVAQFTVGNNTNVVTVTLPNHGYSVGDVYPALVSTTLANVTIFGDYFVTSVGNSSSFTILANTTATANATAGINGNLARYLYSFGVGAVPAGSGFGRGGFGRGGFGTGSTISPAMGNAVAATDWSLDNWGEILLACPVNGTRFQPIYQWDPTGGSPTATVITQAPTVNDGFFVAMPQRQVVAWGSTSTGIQDPLLVRWCDVNDYTQWIATTTNQAGSYRIPRGSKIVGGLQTPNQALLFTDIDVWSMQYLGPPDIYGFNEIGAGCGLIGRKAACTYNGEVFWMGPNQFYTLASGTSGAGGVTPIPCDIWDVAFQDLDLGNVTKIRAAVNSLFGEIQWFYPTNASNGEVSSYIKFNPALNEWDYGTMGRSAWNDQSILGQPIGADPVSLYLYQHETSTDADGSPLEANFTTGFYSIADGDQLTFVDQVFPDAKWSYFDNPGNMPGATLNMVILGCDYPGQTPTQYGPYALTQATTFVSPRLRHRLIAFNFGSDDLGTFWRIGGVRYRYSASGKF